MSSCRTSKLAQHDSYDIAVVGAGSAGFSAAITAAGQGARVALIGQGTIGGTCVNVGCVPSKTLIRAMESIYDAHAASRFAGISGSAGVTDWHALIRQKDELVSSLRQARYVDLLPAYEGVSYLEDKARIVEEGVEFDGGIATAPKVIIATGARPSIPSIPGIESVDYLTSTSALEIDELPSSLLVIGAGYVGVELAQTFARAGVQVTVVCRSHLLPAAEPEIGKALGGYFTDEGIRVVDGVDYDAIESTASGVRLHVNRQKHPEAFEAERVLVATGRTPNVEGLGLDEAGIVLNADGSIQVDERMRTTRAGVYAAGDVIGRDQFVYMAAYGAKIATHNALNGDKLIYDNSAVPTVVFSDPQVASVGFTEAGARQAGHEVKARVLPLDQLPRALAARDMRGLIKLVADSTTDRLLGAHVLAPEAADSIQTATLAIKHGMTVGDLAATIFPYLTTVEGLKLAAQTFETDISLLSCCA